MRPPSSSPWGGAAGFGGVTGARALFRIGAFCLALDTPTREDERWRTGGPAQPAVTKIMPRRSTIPIDIRLRDPCRGRGAGTSCMMLADRINTALIHDLHLHPSSVSLYLYPWSCLPHWVEGAKNVPRGAAKREPTSFPVMARHPLKSRVTLPTLKACVLEGLYQRLSSPVRLSRKCCHLGISIRSCPGW